jgi:mono/diheme cytochrome c family protein
MTAMPAWKETRTPAQLWSLVAFLDALPGMTPQQYRQVVSDDPAPAATARR